MQLIDYHNGIHAFDAGYVRHMLAAIHLVVDDGRAAFIDTGSNASLPHAQAALVALGVAADEVDYVILTHIHLDHAGGAGAMMQVFPNAKLVLHPRGARHMIDPSRLEASARAVYGDAEFDRQFGALVPVPANRVVTLDSSPRKPSMRGRGTPSGSRPFRPGWWMPARRR